MLIRYLRSFFLLATVMVVLACVTINVYFPEAAVQDLSEQIEDAVARKAADAAGEEPADGGEAPESPPPPSGGSSASWLASPFEKARVVASRFAVAVVTVLGPASVYAQDDVAAPEISNPAIQRIIDSRSRRVRELNRLKASGVIGENNEALVEIRDLGSLALQERAAAQKLVRDENSDRERMFKEIAAATGTDLSQLPRVRETYAQTLRDKARRGDWIQMPNGTWRQKP